MVRYGIIQLSDLQFGAKHRFGYPSKICDSIAQDILYMAEKYSFSPIYLLLTGDITETAHTNEFMDAGATIEHLANQISVDKDSILAVPGNHDINWKLAEVAYEVGDENLKYNNYNKFALKHCNKRSAVCLDHYNYFFDHRLGIEFLFLNSCEKEDHNNHFGYIDSEKLVKTIINNSHGTENYTKICICHHRIEPDPRTPKSVIDNSYEIETILLKNGYNIVFTGHIHENRVCEKRDSEKSIIYAGAGSAGVESNQRIDGIPNQYTIHILDSYNKTLESYWRSYSPNKRTKFGLGAWSEDNSVEINPIVFQIPCLIDFDAFSSNSMEDLALIDKYSIKRNPFTYSNAEKISSNQIVKLFVSSEGRNKGAVRAAGDAIIRGSRGSGKTMMLRYLNIFGDVTFDQNFKEKRVSESFPVLVNLSMIHNSEWKSSVNSLIESAEKLIFESVMGALNDKEKDLGSSEFRNALFRVGQKLKVLENQEGSIIWKLGIAIRDNLSKYFTHILLLIDEVAPVFPKEFFTDSENGFLRWMNSIRNSGPYFTRIAVYPNDISDILNEDRFGSIVNLDYNIKDEEDYLSYRSYCIELVNRYLGMVSINKLAPTKISNIIDIGNNSDNDALEQLIYASDGSSRRFTSLMDKCITSTRYSPNKLLDKDDIISIIKDFSSNLLSSYDLSEREIAQSLAKACRKQVTYRFRLPNLSSLVAPLHAKNEELNIVKLAEIGTGRRGTTYEFTYPYCILMDIQTHYLKDTRKICTTRDRANGEWISQVTTIARNQIDYLNKELRLEGIVTEMDGELIVIAEILTKEEYISESFDSELKIGDRVTFIHLHNIASDILKIE
ncbi:metallophosphoesterase family protein [Bacteroides thetaiotaomicron]|uniref:metallophosphoesterase family protein n=1 Tax=Bacteroides thetaiotaomicron TaxID=818 RepID=UPI0039C1E3AB